ncbi:hypothetical protein [Ferrovibrio xuzhouensis]|uniref:Uncharacterized protein n=1 Tax=Ferrovibrio xuzhouensis TaxID=1576914 RepID=A0ABV7VGQ6_9PROT
MDRRKFELAIDRKLEAIEDDQVQFEYDYIALRLAYFFVAKGKVHGKRVAHYGYLEDDFDSEVVEEWIDAVREQFFQPGRLNFVILDNKQPDWLLEDCEQVISTLDGFKVVRPANPTGR